MIKIIVNKIFIKFYIKQKLLKNFIKLVLTFRF